MSKQHLLRTAIATIAAAGAFTSTAHAAHLAQTGVALTDDQRLMVFTTGTPDEAKPGEAVTGLRAGESLIGLDYRPANGLLYAVGTNGGVYTLDAATSAATLVSQLAVSSTGTPAGAPDPARPVTPDGTSFGVDFNPVVNLLRVVSNTGQNLRIQPDTGSTVVDVPLNGVAGAQVVGAAYTQNDNDAATGTRLFDVDTAADQLLQQTDANRGVLAPRGPFGIAVGDQAGFDIWTSATGVDNAFLSISRKGADKLYTVELPAAGTTASAGAATFVAPFGEVAVSDIAIRP